MNRDGRELPPLEALDLLMDLHRVTRRVMRNATARTALSIQELLVLHVLLRHPGSSASQIAEDLEQDPSTITPVLAELLRRRMIAALRDPRDARRSFLRATAGGRAACRAATESAAGLFSRVRSRRGAGEVEALRRVLDELLNHATGERRSPRVLPGGSR